MLSCPVILSYIFRPGSGSREVVPSVGCGGYQQPPHATGPSDLTQVSGDGEQWVGYIAVASSSVLPFWQMPDFECLSCNTSNSSILITSLHYCIVFPLT